MEKEKEEKEKEIKKEKTKKRKIIKIAMLYLETRARSEGYMAKAFKARCPKPSLVGSRRLCVRYMGGWVEFSKLYVLKSRIHSKSGVKPEELVVERSS